VTMRLHWPPIMSTEQLPIAVLREWAKQERSRSLRLQREARKLRQQASNARSLAQEYERVVAQQTGCATHPAT
jgi:hypothetical protein